MALSSSLGIFTAASERVSKWLELAKGHVERKWGKFFGEEVESAAYVVPKRLNFGN